MLWYSLEEPIRGTSYMSTNNIIFTEEYEKYLDIPSYLKLCMHAHSLVSVFLLVTVHQPIVVGSPVKGSLANSADQDQMPQNAASDQALHHLQIV